MRRSFGMLAAAVMLAAFGVSAAGQSMFHKVNDFDGDGRADYVVTGSEDGLKVWHIWQTTAGYLRIQWGLSSTDWNASADYDGDGRYDVAVARPGPSTPQGQSMTYYALQSSTGTPAIYTLDTGMFAGFAGAQDYDGDGKADPAIQSIHGQTSIFYRSSLTGELIGATLPGGIAVRIGTLNLDARAELASYVTSTPARLWYVESPGGGPVFRDFGTAGDELVAGDLDNDGRGEIMVFRPGTGDWYWRYSALGNFGHLQWGQNGDIPVPADYDGDGRTDQAVYRPGSPNGVYYINGSTAGLMTFVWGTPEHQVVGY